MFDFVKFYEQMIGFIVIDDIGFLCDNLKFYLILIWNWLKINI